MANPTLAIYLFGFNLERIRYPWRAAVSSALELADHVYFCECYSTDGTGADILTWANYEPRLTVIRNSWEGDYHIQAIIGNKLLNEIGTKYDYAMKMDADEVLCEWTFDTFKKQLLEESNKGTVLLRPRYLHFCPDDRTTFPFIYDSKAVISRTKDHLRFSLGHGGDACALGGAAEAQTDLLLHHYGKLGLGREEQALYKELSFQEKYIPLNAGFPDPLVVKQKKELGYIDYRDVFTESRDKGWFKPYTGPHPKFVQEWLVEQHQRSEEFWSNHAKA